MGKVSHEIETSRPASPLFLSSPGEPVVVQQHRISV